MQSFEFSRYKAAQGLGLASLPVELTAEQIARLYAQDMLACRDFIKRAIQTGALKARTPALEPAMTAFPRYSGESSEQYWERIGRRLRGLDSEPPRFIHVTDFAAWAGKPPIPEGEAGERVRAWLSLAQAAEMAASAETPPPAPESDVRGGDYLPLFSAIKVVRGMPERVRCDLTPDGNRIYGLIERHRRDGLAMPVRTRTVEANGRVETYYCLRDVIVWVRRELPEVQISENAVKHFDAELRRCMDDDPERIDAWERYAIKIPLLEKERAELEAATPQTPSDSKYKRERLAEIDREVAALKEHGPIAEPPAQAVEPVAAEDAVKAVALPAQPRRESERRSRDTWTSVMRLAIQSALNEWERRKRGDTDVFQFVRDWLEKDDRFDSKPTDSGVVWSYQLAAGSFKEIKDASLCKNIRREMDRRAKQRESDTVRTARTL